jgi:helicase SWR1
METSPRLRGHRRADYAVLAGRRSQVSPTLLSSPSSPRLQDSQTAATARPGKQNRLLAREEHFGSGFGDASNTSLADMLQQDVLYADVLQSCLSERLRELARRAAASRDEHRRQAQLLHSRVERDQKRKRGREQAPGGSLKRPATRAPLDSSSDLDMAPRSRHPSAGSANALKRASGSPERTVLPFEEQKLSSKQQDRKPCCFTGSLTSADFDHLQAGKGQLDETVLSCYDPELESRREMEERILREAVEIQQRNLESAKNRLPKQPEPPRSKTHHDYFCESIIWLATDYREQFKWKASARGRIHRALHKYHEERRLRQAREADALETSRRRQAKLLSREVRKFWEALFRMMISERLEVDEYQRKRERTTKLDALVRQAEQYTQALASRLALSDAEKASSSSASTSGQETDQQVALKANTAPSDQADAYELNVDHSEGDAQHEHLNSWQQHVAEQIQQMLRVPRSVMKTSLSTGNTNEHPMIGTARTSYAIQRNAQASLSAMSTGPNVVLGEATSENEDLLLSDRQGNALGQAISPDDFRDSTRSAGTSPVGQTKDEERMPSQEHPSVTDLRDSTRPAGTSPVGQTKDVMDIVLHPSADESGREALSDAGTVPGLLFRGQLRPYQRAGVQWLIALHEKGLNGMLADEMGLGKTIQTITLLAWLAVAKQDWGPHLVVVPTSVVMNWDIEFKKFAPGLKVLCYFGSPQERASKRRGWTRPNAYHVCITSYQMVVQDATIFRRQRWSYLVLDEAQHIKNFQSQKWQTLLTFHTRHRLLLTGTPLQNSLVELWSLLHFLMPQVFRSHSEFKEWFQEPIETLIEADANVQDTLVQRLHRVLRPFVLRRLKRDVERDLPPKTEEIMWCALSKRQRELYDDFLSRASTREKLASGNYLSVMNVLIQLRKVCNHPDLFAGRPIQEPYMSQRPLQLRIPRAVHAPQPRWNGTTTITNRVFDESLDPQDAARMRALAAAGRLLCEQEASASMQSTQVERGRWTHLQAQLEAEEFQERQALRLVSCTRFVAEPLIGPTLRRLVQVALRPPPSLHPWTVLERVVDTLMVPALPYGMVAQRVWAPVPHLISHAAWSHQRLEYRPTPTSIAYLMGLLRPLASRQQLHFPDTRLLQWDCGKLQRLATLLRTLERQGHRVLIFTQMARMLDILEQFLCLHRFAYIRMDGTTPTDRRLRLCERFNTDTRYLAFLSTTRSGGIGLNLTGADTVLFYDSDWNPTIDAQAQDRCHRIGQERPVRIYRLISESTVEEHILRRAMQKQRLERLVMAHGLFTTEVLQRVHPLELVTDSMDRPLPYPKADGELSECGLTEKEYQQLESVVLEAEDEEERAMRRAMELAASANASLEAADFAETRPSGPSSAVSSWWPVWHTAWQVGRALGGPVAALEEAPTAGLVHWKQRSHSPDDANDNDAIKPLVYPSAPIGHFRAQKNEQGGLDTISTMIYGPPVEAPDDLVLDPEAGSEDAAFFIHAYTRVARSTAPTRSQVARLREFQRLASNVQKKQPRESHRVAPAAVHVSGAGTLQPLSRHPLVTSKSDERVRSNLLSPVSLGLEREALLNPQTWTRHRPQWSLEEDLVLLQLWHCGATNGHLLADVLQARPGVRLGLLPRRSGRELYERLQQLLVNGITEPAALLRWRGSTQTASWSKTIRKQHQRSLQLAQRRILAMRARLDGRKLLSASGAGSDRDATLSTPLLDNEASTAATMIPSSRSDRLPSSLASNGFSAQQTEHETALLAPVVESLDPRSLGRAEASSTMQQRPGVKLEEELRRKRPFRRHPASLGRLLGFERRSDRNSSNSSHPDGIQGSSL